MKKTKIVCTIGPQSESLQILEQLLLAGMDVMRLNFSHGNEVEHGARIKNFRQVLENLQLAGVKKNGAIILDTKGPEIRTKTLKDKRVNLKVGQTFRFHTDDNIEGDENQVAVTYKNFAQDLKVGDSVLVDDGLIAMRVVAIENNAVVVCRVENAGILGQNKGVNLPGVSVNLPPLSEKDRRDLIFGCEQKVDFVAASFIRSAAHVEEIRKHLNAHGGKEIKIISKIENKEGVDNFDEILAASDGIMIARGDLGVEIPVEEVIFVQKHIIKKCNAACKLVITATQMLDSMINNPRPTRAEAGDVANAILDGSDSVMLSGETANGRYPVETVSIMATICQRAEREVAKNRFAMVWGRCSQENSSTMRYPLNESTHPISSAHYTEEENKTRITEVICREAVEAAEKLGVSLIVVATREGDSAKYIRKYCPTANILALTSDEKTVRQLALHRGIFAKVQNIDSTDDFYHIGKREALACNMAKAGECVVMVRGALVERGTTNMVSVHILD